MATSKLGYIYVRDHESYIVYNVYKLGKADNIPERDTQYGTGEVKRGKFVAVYEMPQKKTTLVENHLKDVFKPFHFKIDSGTEFYDRKVLTLIEPTLDKLNLVYRRLTDIEIAELRRKQRIRSEFQLVKQKIREIGRRRLRASRAYKCRNMVQPVIKDNTELITAPTPRDDQIEIINKSVEYYSKYDKGMLVLICGVGKTLLSLWITQLLGLCSILIGVPNKLLRNQWKDAIKMIYGKIPCLTVCDDIDIDNIKRFLVNAGAKTQKHAIITTYASSYKVYKAAQECGHTFDMKINDEVHHLTTTNYNEVDRKLFVNMLRIPCKKQISLTATMKVFDELANNEPINKELTDTIAPVESPPSNRVVISNNNKEHFGEVIERKTMLWAINKGIICDYLVQTIMVDVEQLETHFARFNIVDDNDKRLFLAAFVALKSINDGHSHHLLVYANTKANSIKIIEYIILLIDSKYFKIPDLFYSSYHGDMNTRSQRGIIDGFTTAKHGIITCVYCLGEGWDLPLLDGEVYAENMSSPIRIVQTALRACRKNKAQPDKIFKVILTIFTRDNEDWFSSNNPDMKKITEVIYQLGCEDETIEQKIKVYKIAIKAQSYKNAAEYPDVREFGEYDEWLTSNLRLKTMARFAMMTYEKARKLIAPYGIKSKAEYYELCNKDNRLSREPDIQFGASFVNWIDYLSIAREFYDLAECKRKIAHYMELQPELKSITLKLSDIVDKLCKLDVLFPPSDLWVEYYMVNSVRDIIAITIKKKKNRQYIF